MRCSILKFIKTPIFFAALAIAGAWLAYAVNFFEGFSFSKEKGDWGTFGDFVGGFANPILTFITTYMLIKSLGLQKDANQAILDQNLQIRESEGRQRELEDLRSFEATFYSLADVARQEFSNLKIKSIEGLEYREGAAVSYIEEEIIKTLEENISAGSETDFLKVFNDLDDRSSMGVFSSVRSFFILFKVVCENCPLSSKGIYIDICTYIMPIKFLNLVCLAKAFSDWKILELLEVEGFFEKEGLNDYLREWCALKEGD
ncbi:MULTISPECIES: hypothetical protein [Pseudomonas]|nr:MULTISPECIES: hypothetical protein [Pseudomonas]